MGAFPPRPRSDPPPMQGISNTGCGTCATSLPAQVSLKQAMGVSVMKMEQDQERAQGDANAKLIAAAAEVQMTGKGGQVDVVG